MRLKPLFVVPVLLLLGCAPDPPARPAQVKPAAVGSAVVVTTPVVSISAPSWRTQLETALSAANTARWYAYWAAQPPPPTPRVRPAPVSDPGTPADAPVPTYDVGSIEQDILDVFGPAGPRALRVARCESNFDPGAVNRKNPSVRGIFQIHVSWSEKWELVIGEPYESTWMDAGKNIRFAKWLYDQSGGWGPWACKG